MHDAEKIPLILDEQGSFAVGGTVITHCGAYHLLNPANSPKGQTLHGDHAYVFYQRPVNARRLPLVFLHGHDQCSKTWETTPDGREGFQTLFLRRRYSVYLVDQPHRGKAGRSSAPAHITATPNDQSHFNRCRLGIWPDYFPDVQFARNPEALNQYFRQITPNTGPGSRKVVSEAMTVLFARIGPAILVAHSQAGGSGWLTAIKSANVHAIVSFEPGTNFVFPEGEVPPAMTCSAGVLEAIAVPMESFRKLTKIPIVVYYGDYIPKEPVANPGQDGWRVRLAMAHLWAQAVNRHGGDATIVHLPAIGIRGNTHFPFSDLNNVEVADLLERFLESKRLA